MVSFFYKLKHRFCILYIEKIRKPKYILNLFGAEDEGRTELPSERKKRRAREEEGRVVNSAEINQTIVLAVTLSMVALLAGFYVETLKRFAVETFSMMSAVEKSVSEENVWSFIVGVIVVMLKIIGPLLAAALFVGIASNVAQTKFLFTTKNIKVDFKRIAPTWKNLKDRVLFSPQNLMNMVKVLFKMIIVLVITTLTVRRYYPRLLIIGTLSLSDSVVLFFNIVLEMFFKVIAFMSVVAVIDYIFQKRQYIETLKMTKFEMKEEFKEMEGNPLVKGKLQEMAKRIVNRSMFKAVPEADVVITNPTHFAVALKYEEGSMRAPIVVAKGTDNIALKIKEIAKGSDIEIIENKPLARELYYNVEIGDYIPEKMFYVVSRILAAVYRMRRNKPRNRRA